VLVLFGEVLLAAAGVDDNLTKADFDLIEDTVPQKIAHFARSLDVPLTLGLIAMVCEILFPPVVNNCRRLPLNGIQRIFQAEKLQ
jgi:hypothetical protein